VDQQSGLKPEPKFTGFIEMLGKPAGTSISKQDMAAAFGYVGKTGWRDHGAFLRGLLSGFYEERDVRTMVRTSLVR
jgi:hypothetical protein